ncbi:MAG: FYDLN acid domain-containing protein [Hyphomicrobiaceae bacterium]
MADKAARGTKRTCQSGSCGSRFYDLGRDPIVCPICGSTYVIARGPAVPEREERRAARKPEIVAAPDPGVAPEVEVDGDDALVDVEGGDEPLADAEDDTFLEEEDSGGDVSDIIVGGGEDEEES